MRNRITAWLVGMALCVAAPAFSQSQSVQQSGQVTNGHAAGWVYNGIIQDAGNSTNPNLNTLGVYGTGTPVCVSNTQVRTGGWYNLCFGYNSDSSAANISLTPFGGAPNIPLNITADGSTFPIGPGSLSTLLDQQMGAAQGDIIYRNATTWVALTPGSSGDFLSTQGPAANPLWAAGTSLSPIAANSVIANTTGSTGTPTASSIPSCSSPGQSLQYVANTGFSCSVAVAQNYKTGLILSTAGSSAAFGISIGEAADSTNVATMSLASAYTKTTSTWALGTAAGCLDTGTISNSTWYSEFIIERTDTGVTDILCSLSATSPTLPTNYTLFRRIGSMKTDGSAHWTLFTQLANTFLWSAPVLDMNNLTSGTTSAILTTLTVPSGVKVTALNTIFVTASVSNSVILYVSSPDATDLAANVTTGVFSCYSLSESPTPISETCAMQTRTNTSSQIRLRFNQTDTTYYGATNGWIDSFGGN